MVRAVNHKIDAEVLLNAALAGGVMMGAGCDIIVSPGLCMMSGAIVGVISAFGFLYGTEFVRDKINLHDTCGVLWLHGVPGILGSLVVVFAVAVAKTNFENDVQT